MLDGHNDIDDAVSKVILGARLTVVIEQSTM